MDKKEIASKILREVGIVLAMIILPIIFLIAYASAVTEHDNIFYIIVLFVCILIPFYGAPWYLIHKYAKGTLKKILYVLLVMYIPVISAVRGDYHLINNVLGLVGFMAILVLIGKSINPRKVTNRVTYTLRDVDDMDGHSFEKFCALVMERNGFKDVIVTPGSGDQGVDIVAKKDGIQYAVQCKCYSSKLGNTPIQEVCAGKFMYGCQIGVVMTNSYFTENARALAEKTGVLLWDRNVLVGMMQK